jgi:hypothetical protein
MSAVNEEAANEDAEEGTTEEPVLSEVQVPEGVLDPTLFRLTMAVVAHMNVLVVEYLARDGYKYVPNRETRSVKAYDSGWPNVGLKTKDESTVAHGALFAHERNSIHPFEYNDMDAMHALDQYVRERPALLERLQVPGEDEVFVGEFAEMMLRHRIADLPASIYDRAMALGLNIGDPVMADLYMQREKSWLAPELRYQYVVPLVVTTLDIGEEGLQVDERSRIVRLTDDDLRRMAQSYEIAGVPGPLADAARYAVVIDMPPMDNPGEGRRMFMPQESINTQVIEDVCEALRVVSNARTGWARIFRRPIGWADNWEDGLPNLNHIYTARRYPAMLDDRGWRRSNPAITAEAAAQVPATAAALKAANAQTKLATRRLSMALVRDAADDQLIDACIGLEALLGQKGAELSYRIAVRAAALLARKATDPRSPQAVFKMARKVYERRSELVHVSASGKNAVFQPIPDGDPVPTHSVGVWLLREVLPERLLRPDWTVEELDALVLEGLEPAGASGPPGDAEGANE